MKTEEYSSNAGGGLRGDRAEFTKDLREILCDEYGFDKSAAYTDLGGSSSLNLLVETNQTQYVVRVYRPYITSNRVNDILRIRKALNKNGIPCSETYKNKNGQDWIAWNGRIVEVEHYIETDGIMENMERLKSALTLFGRMTSVLYGVENVSADTKHPHFANHIHFERITEMTEKGCERILSWNPTEHERDIIYLAKMLTEKVAHAGEKIYANLPKQLGHGDFWDNNVLFKGNEIVLITDLDFMGERRRIEDIALTMYFTYISEGYCKSEAMSPGRAVELKLLLNIYDSGLANKLTEAEKTALPIAIALQALWGIGGWVVLLDDENAARNHASGMMWEFEQCKYIMDNLREWQTIFYG
jgi:homoserine kinase type II